MLKKVLSVIFPTLSKKSNQLNEKKSDSPVKKIKILTTVKPNEPKAYSPIELRPSNSVMLVKLEQFRNVLFPMEFTLLGIVILVKAVQSPKV